MTAPPQLMANGIGTHRTAPLVSTPRDLPALREWLGHQWREGQPWWRYGSAMCANERPGSVREANDAARRYATWEQLALGSASLWWISPEMMMLLQVAMKSVPDDVLVDELTPPSMFGLVWFATPLMGTSIGNEEKIAVHSIVWGSSAIAPLGPCLSCSSYTLLDFDAGLTGSSIQFATHSGAFRHGVVGERLYNPETWTATEQGKAAGFAEEDGSLSNGFSDLRTDEIPAYMQDQGHAQAQTLANGYKIHGRSLAPLGRSDWPIDERLDAPPPYIDADQAEMAAESFQEDRRLLAALFTLLTQPALTTRTVERPDRAARRRIQRAGAGADQDVQVITLRRPKAEPSEPGGGDTPKREYDHRWIVQPHWRRQPYGPGRSQTKLIMIPPHVKGPADKPLKAPTRVNALIR